MFSLLAKVKNNELSIESKISLKVVVQFGMLFESFSQKVKVKRSFGLKAAISSLSKLGIQSKDSFTKVIQFGMLFENGT